MDQEEIRNTLKQKGITIEKLLEIAKKKLAEAKKAGSKKTIKEWEKRIIK